jgi:thiosulfate reductase cytochrome b subunit
MLYLLRFFNRVFMGRQTHPNKFENSREMIFTIVLLGVFGLLIGVFIKPLWEVMDNILTQMVGGYYG